MERIFVLVYKKFHLSPERSTQSLTVPPRLYLIGKCGSPDKIRVFLLEGGEMEAGQKS